MTATCDTDPRKPMPMPMPMTRPSLAMIGVLAIGIAASAVLLRPAASAEERGWALDNLLFDQLPADGWQRDASDRDDPSRAQYLAGWLTPTVVARTDVHRSPAGPDETIDHVERWIDKSQHETGLEWEHDGAGTFRGYGPVDGVDSPVRSARVGVEPGPEGSTVTVRTIVTLR